MLESERKRTTRGRVEDLVRISIRVWDVARGELWMTMGVCASPIFAESDGQRSEPAKIWPIVAHPGLSSMTMR